MTDDEFEWDDAKAEANLKKHGVSFATATRVFDDAFAFVEQDIGDDHGEERIIAVGMVEGRLHGTRRPYPHHLGTESHQQ